MRNLLNVLLILFFSISVVAQDDFDERLKNLVLRAKVVEVKIDRSDERYPQVKLKLKVSFRNEGNKPIIILQKTQNNISFSDLIFSVGVSVYGSNENGDYPISGGGGLPSTCIGCNERFVKPLDKKIPPDKYTKILKPNESVILNEEEVFGFPLKASSGEYGWNEVKANNWKIYGRIVYSMFPINLGKYGENFGQKLQKRWQSYGLLYVGDTHSLITSERFEIDLSDVKF